MSPGNRPLSLWAAQALKEIGDRGQRRHLEPLSSPQGPVIEVGGRPYLNLSSNDYLGLAADPRLSKAASEALGQLGVGSGASRLVVGDTAAHQALEQALATFFGSEAACLFNSGYAANVGLLSTVVGEGDVIFSDAQNHASIIDGCRLSRARTVVYPHRDLKALRALLRENPGRRRLLVTDAVFSMDGTLAPLSEWVQLAREFGAGTLVDEAHAVGVCGPTGAGLCEALHLQHEVDLRVGTCGKALGTHGAFVASSREVCDWLVNRARSLVFSTSLPAALCVATQASLALVREEPERRKKLWDNIRFFAEGLSALGLPAAPHSAIFPWVLGTPEKALEASRRLKEAGIWARAIRPPTVPEGQSRIRLALSAAHSTSQLEDVLRAMERILR